MDDHPSAHWNLNNAGRPRPSVANLLVEIAILGPRATTVNLVRGFNELGITHASDVYDVLDRAERLKLVRFVKSGWHDYWEAVK